MDKNKKSSTLGYVYDPAEWEATYAWEDRGYLEDELRFECWEPKEIKTLAHGPSKWARQVVLTRDEQGDPDETEIQWFDSLEEAKKAGI